MTIDEAIIFFSYCVFANEEAYIHDYKSVEEVVPAFINWLNAGEQRRNT